MRTVATSGLVAIVNGLVYTVVILSSGVTDGKRTGRKR